jgi:hypothetical protein
VDHVVKVLLDLKAVSLERLLLLSDQFNSPYLLSSSETHALPPNKVLELITSNSYIIASPQVHI